jgi:glycine cleavage system H protein
MILVRLYLFNRQDAKTSYFQAIESQKPWRTPRLGGWTIKKLSKGDKMNTPTNLKYTKSDEWFDPSSGAMGISDYAQSQLSDIVFVEILVEEGETIEVGKAIASVESVKASAEIYASAGGKVTAVNKGLSDKPETLNSDPYGAAWMVKVEGGTTGDVMDAAAYEKYCEGRTH